MPYTRKDWEEANAVIEAIRNERKALVAPTEERYNAALNHLHEVIEGLGVTVNICEACEKPIFEGEQYFVYSEGVATCEKCAPMLSDIVNGYRHELSLDNPDYGYFSFSSLEEFRQKTDQYERNLKINGDRKILNAGGKVGE